MGAAGKILDKFGASRELSETADNAMEVIKTFSDAVSAAKTAYAGAKWALTQLGFLEEEIDPLTELSSKVQALTALVEKKFAEVLDKVQIVFILTTRQKIAELVSEAGTGLKILAPHPPGSPAFLNREDDADAASHKALDTLSNDSYWQRPYHEPWVYADPWSGPLKPPGAGLMVFDYRLALPAYLEAIALRIAIVSLIGLDRKVEYAQRADFLLQKHDTILQGIAGLRPPGLKEFAPFYTETGSFSVQHKVASIEFWRNDSLWAQRARQLGAVERYSAAAVTEAYPPITLPKLPEAPEPLRDDGLPAGPNEPPTQAGPNEPPPGSPSDSPAERARKKKVEQYELRLQSFRQAMAAYDAEVGRIYGRFLLRHAVRTLLKQKEVYAGVGLPAVWQSVNHLRRLAGKPPLGLCDFSAHSLRDLHGLVPKQGADGSFPSNLLDPFEELGKKMSEAAGGGPVVSLREAAGRLPAAPTLENIFGTSRISLRALAES